MNLTIGNGKLNNWQTLKTRYIAAACGVALAAAAVTGVASMERGGGATSATSAVPSASYSVPQRGPDQHTVFIAGSEQQAIDMRASVLQDLDPSQYSGVSFVVAASAAEDVAARYAIDEAAREESGVAMRVVDLRGPRADVAPATPVSAAASSRIAPYVTSGPGEVAFYIVADQAGAAQVQAMEEHAQWVRYGSGVEEPNRSIVTLFAGTADEHSHALGLIDNAMAAGNFSDSNPAPRFSVVDMR
jgi:hypothetical protein